MGKIYCMSLSSLYEMQKHNNAVDNQVLVICVMREQNMLFVPVRRWQASLVGCFVVN